jgi:hypothetical protein
VIGNADELWVENHHRPANVGPLPKSLEEEAIEERAFEFGIHDLQMIQLREWRLFPKCMQLFQHARKFSKLGVLLFVRHRAWTDTRRYKLREHLIQDCELDFSK